MSWWNPYDYDRSNPNSVRPSSGDATPGWTLPSEAFFEGMGFKEKQDGTLGNALFDILKKAGEVKSAAGDVFEYKGPKERLGPPIPDHLKQKSPLDILMQTITGGGPKLTPPPAVGGIPQLPGMDLNDYVDDPNIKNAVNSLIGSQNTPLKGQIAERRKLLNQDIKTLSFLDRAHKKNLKDLNRDVKREAANSGKKQQKIAKNSVANYARETDSAISSDLGQLSDSALAQYNAEASRDVANMDQAHNELADIQRQRTAGTNDFMSDLIASTSLATTEDTAKVQRSAEADIDQYNTQITANNQQAPALIQQYAQQQMQNALASYSAQMQAWAAQNDAAQQAWQNQNAVPQQAFDNSIKALGAIGDAKGSSGSSAEGSPDLMEILKFATGDSKNKVIEYNKDEQGKPIFDEKIGESYKPRFDFNDPDDTNSVIQMLQMAGVPPQVAWSLIKGNISEKNYDSVREQALFPYMKVS